MKSFPNITAIFKFLHTKNVWSKVSFLMIMLHLMHPSTPNLEPFAPTTDGKFVSL